MSRTETKDHHTDEPWRRDNGPSFRNESMIMNTTGGEDVDEDAKCSIYGALTRVKADRSVPLLSVDGPDYSAAHARTRDTTQRGKCYKKR